MATSAFKSTSRRGTAEPKAPPPPSLRRSLSVSAVSRKTHLPFDDSNSITSEFSVKRDNPLFWTSTSSPPDKDEVSRANGEITFTNKKQSSHSSYNSNSRSSGTSVSEQRGRSVTRSGSGNGSVNNGIGRSLSRVRGRSVSRARDKEIYESENDIVKSMSARSMNKKEQIVNGINRTNSVKNMVGKLGGAKNSLTAAHNQATEWSEDDSAFNSQISNLEDGLSTGSLSEAEEKTIKASVGKQQETDMPTNGIYETVRSEVRRVISDIQNDLESSEERARKLRADLAIEEHCGQELNRILKEIIPDSKSSSLQKSRRGRRPSNERKRMSKRLNDEAMAYFDECVSLSTFDSSDFSAPEDPPYASVGATAPVGASSLVKGNQINSCCYDHQKQLLHSDEDSVTAISRSSCEPGISSQSFQFSFTDKQSENEDIRSYVKHFKKDKEKELELEGKRSHYDAEEYNIRSRYENVFGDRVLYRDRIESGGLLLCGAAFSFLPFASVL